jgi:hypothetical protein
VLLLGTFHFADAGHDWYKPRHTLAVESHSFQQEVQEIVARLAAFAPTKIAVERRMEHQELLDTEYEAYQRGAFPLPASEVYQLGFQLAQRLNHQRVYAIDALGRYYDPPLDLEPLGVGHAPAALNQLLATHYQFDPLTRLREYAQTHQQAEQITRWEQMVMAAGLAADVAKTTRSLRETLLAQNQIEQLRADHGQYLSGWFQIGTGHAYPGVDYVTAWFNRNLRIFANLQRITEEPHDRVLVIYGAGHIPLLRHCVESLPTYHLVEVAAYLA